jgi:CMP-2-keto-3-deoxyoctulosonic acid synthetase
MSYYGFIFARGGSKRIIDKNIVDFHGIPLIARAIETCKKSKYIQDIIVSTDSEKIAKIAKQYDAKIIKDKMGENKELLEFIIATLYKLAASDHIFSEQENKDIQKIALIFGLKQTLFKKFVNRFPILKSTYAGFNKNI